MCSPVRKPARWVVFFVVILPATPFHGRRSGGPTRALPRPAPTHPDPQLALNKRRQRSAGPLPTRSAPAHAALFNPLKAAADAGERQSGSDDWIHIAQNRGISMV